MCIDSAFRDRSTACREPMEWRQKLANLLESAMIELRLWTDDQARARRHIP